MCVSEWIVDVGYRRLVAKNLNNLRCLHCILLAQMFNKLSLAIQACVREVDHCPSKMCITEIDVFIVWSAQNHTSGPSRLSYHSSNQHPTSAGATVRETNTGGATSMTMAGLEPAIFGSEDQRLIH